MRIILTLFFVLHTVSSFGTTTSSPLGVFLQIEHIDRVNESDFKRIVDESGLSVHKIFSTLNIVSLRHNKKNIQDT